MFKYQCTIVDRMPRRPEATIQWVCTKMGSIPTKYNQVIHFSISRRFVIRRWRGSVYINTNILRGVVGCVIYTQSQQLSYCQLCSLDGNDNLWCRQGRMMASWQRNGVIMRQGLPLQVSTANYFRLDSIQVVYASLYQIKVSDTHFRSICTNFKSMA